MGQWVTKLLNPRQKSLENRRAEPHRGNALGSKDGGAVTHIDSALGAGR